MEVSEKTKEFNAIQEMIKWIKYDIQKDETSSIKNDDLKEILIHEKSRYLEKAIFLNRYSNYKSIDSDNDYYDSKSLPNIYVILEKIKFNQIAEDLESRIIRSGINKHTIDNILFSIIQEFYEELYKQIQIFDDRYE